MQARESVQGQKAIEHAFSAVLQDPSRSRRSPCRSNPSGFSTRQRPSRTARRPSRSPSGQVIEQNRYMVVYAKQDGAWRMATARDLPGRAGVGRRGIQRSSVADRRLGRRDTRRDGDDFLSFGRRRPLDPVSDFHVQVAGKPAMTGTQRIGWDPHAGKLHSWVHDSEGGFAEGTWTRNGNQWVVKMNGVTHDGSRRSSTNIFTHVGQGPHDLAVARPRRRRRDVMPNVEPFVVVRKAPTPQ